MMMSVLLSGGINRKRKETYRHGGQQIISVNDGNIVLDVVEDSVDRDGQDI